jgi:electron transport complex protein RnfD
MNNRKKLIVSHAPFWHDGSNVFERNYHIMLAAIPAVVLGWMQYGMPAVGVVCLSVSSAIFWEYAMGRITRQPITVGDGQAALIGLMFAMLLPATMPWWAVLTGTFIAVVVGKFIFGGIGSNPFNPAVLSVAILMVSWKHLFDFDQSLLTYDLGFNMVYPLAALKSFGIPAIEDTSKLDLLLGRQTGGIGATFGLGLIAGGLYLIVRGFIRWEISFSFLAGVFFTALLFNISDPARFADPFFHLFTGYTLIGAFFLATDDSSSPVNFVPMLIYGACGGVMTVLIRNIGAWIDGVMLAILVANLVNPLVDKIRPKAIGKVV